MSCWLIGHDIDVLKSVHDHEGGFSHDVTRCNRCKQTFEEWRDRGTNRLIRVPIDSNPLDVNKEINRGK